MTSSGSAARLFLVWAMLVGLSAFARAADVPADAQLGESVVFIKNNRLLPVDLETTVFKPEGEGPFPVVLINHGKDTGNNHLQPRARYLPATREFLQRGYAVVLPMRQGFSRSGGTAVGEGCGIGGNGEAQAQELHPVVSWLEHQSWADTSRMVMIGQSHGGLATLAYAQQPHPGFRLFVNFAGGLKYTSGCQWELALKQAFAAYGARTQVPSLWFYGANDSYFPPEVIRPAYDAYVQAGGRAELVAFGAFGADAHGLFASYDGLPLWWPRVETQLKALGLPTEITLRQYARMSRMAVPAASAYAAVGDVEKVPYLRESGRAGYRVFLDKPLPRAFAIAPGGAWAWANGGEDPLHRALETCNKHGKGACRLYAVNDQIVWKADGP